MEGDDRLLAHVGALPRTHRDDPEARLRAVVAHLGALLNTRAGSSLLDPTYGLPDLTDQAHAATTRSDALAQQVAACVRRHEPRLTQVSVRAEPARDDAPACLRFALSAALADGTPLRLAGQIGRGGQVSLRNRSA